MCLNIPVKILEIKDNKAIAVYPEQGRGNFEKRQEVNTELVKDIGVGDYALISNGFIIKKIPTQEAEEIFKIIKKPQSFDGARRGK